MSSACSWIPAAIRLAGHSTPLFQQQERHALRQLTDDRSDVKLFSEGGPEPALVRHVGDKCESLMSTLVMRSQCLRLKMSLAAAFWTDWSRWMWVRGKSIRRLLHSTTCWGRVQKQGNGRWTLHAFTGCDSTSAKRLFQKLIKPDSLIKASAVMLPQ